MKAVPADINFLTQKAESLQFVSLFHSICLGLKLLFILNIHTKTIRSLYFVNGKRVGISFNLKAISLVRQYLYVILITNNHITIKLNSDFHWLRKYFSQVCTIYKIIELRLLKKKEKSSFFWLSPFSQKTYTGEMHQGEYSPKGQ